MEEQLITFETAKLAKEKGFNIKSCFPLSYDDKGQLYNLEYQNLPEDSGEFYCVTQSLLQKWLREANGAHVNIHLGSERLQLLYINSCFINEFRTYEEALERGLQRALNLI
jgi:hypothetical protein